MRVLALDTSNQTMSIAVTEASQLIGEYTTHLKRNHSERLMPAIHQLMEDVEWAPKTLDRLVVAAGPGSYTGLRIGVTIAKTLAYSLNKELAVVSSLEVLAANRIGSPHYIVPFFDARRSNVYAGIYKSVNGELDVVLQDTHLPAKELAQTLQEMDGTFELVSPDVHMYTELFSTHLGARLMPIPKQDHFPRASVLALLGEQKASVDVHTYTPAYLKLTEAEENWKEQNPDEVGGDWIETY